MANLKNTFSAYLSDKIFIYGVKRFYKGWGSNSSTQYLQIKKSFLKLQKTNIFQKHMKQEIRIV
jgi:hypothetical protein